MKKTIVYDEKVPYVAEFLGGRYDLRPMPAGKIDSKAAAEADALIIRTRTKVDSRLLEGSRCKVVATATIGTDHIDLAWCKANGIAVSNAPGCNAPAVAQWVFAAIAGINEQREKPVIGVVGAGHVGSIVAAWGCSMGFEVMVCDPPRQRAEGGDFHSLDEIAANADIITFHTPLTTDGPDATYHLAGSRFTGMLKRRPYILNAARGPVTDTKALLDALESGAIAGTMIDCWEGEPDIDRELLEKSIVATPHIAGYSLEGKIRATAMAAHAIDRALGNGSQPEPDLSHIVRDAEGHWIDIPLSAPEAAALDSVAASYDIMADTMTLKTTPEEFENLRNNYHLRHEVRL